MNVQDTIRCHAFLAREENAPEGVEELRPRSADNLERGVVILAVVTIRLLQPQELIYPPTPRHGQPERDLAEQPCDTILSTTEWCVLYMSVKKIAPPAQPPNAE